MWSTSLERQHTFSRCGRHFVCSFVRLFASGSLVWLTVYLHALSYACLLLCLHSCFFLVCFCFCLLVVGLDTRSSHLVSIGDEAGSVRVTACGDDIGIEDDTSENQGTAVQQVQGHVQQEASAHSRQTGRQVGRQRGHTKSWRRSVLHRLYIGITAMKYSYLLKYLWVLMLLSSYNFLWVVWKTKKSTKTKMETKTKSNMCTPCEIIHMQYCIDGAHVHTDMDLAKCVYINSHKQYKINCQYSGNYNITGSERCSLPRWPSLVAIN